MNLLAPGPGPLEAALLGMIHDIMSTWCLLPQIDAPGVETWKEHRAVSLPAVCRPIRE
jgi:hypothetical protein